MPVFSDKRKGHLLMSRAMSEPSVLLSPIFQLNYFLTDDYESTKRNWYMIFFSIDKNYDSCR